MALQNALGGGFSPFFACLTHAAENAAGILTWGRAIALAASARARGRLPDASSGYGTVSAIASAQAQHVATDPFPLHGFIEINWHQIEQRKTRVCLAEES